MYPGGFKTVYMKDSGFTGNLEIHIAKSPHTGNPLTQVHTKQGGEGYPHDDWEKFHERLEEAKKKLES